MRCRSRPRRWSGPWCRSRSWSRATRLRVFDGGIINRSARSARPCHIHITLRIQGYIKSRIGTMRRTIICLHPLLFTVSIVLDRRQVRARRRSVAVANHVRVSAYVHCNRPCLICDVSWTIICRTHCSTPDELYFIVPQSSEDPPSLYSSTPVT